MVRDNFLDKSVHWGQIRAWHNDDYTDTEHPDAKLEQLERLRSEDTPRRLLITHTIESYWIPSQRWQSQSYKF